ncbi:MAG TPA: hypothetical protein DHW61_15235 [Lachnoclostridium phytofermentans]|uniref:Uncharacterized protein n=1 Tax=Lachnoclostridium phytofermentans TaxID=66219 RepID=A0A3D2XAV7_9FIRM|nr:hypothetical protein [Lachnoclostridium phytofermentans]
MISFVITIFLSLSTFLDTSSASSKSSFRFLLTESVNTIPKANIDIPPNIHRIILPVLLPPATFVVFVGIAVGSTVGIAVGTGVGVKVGSGVSVGIGVGVIDLLVFSMYVLVA